LYICIGNKAKLKIKKMETKTKNAENAKNVETKVSAEAKVKANIIEMLVSRQQHFIYKVQAQAEKLPAKKAKQYRQKMRRILENFYFKICLQKNSETKKAAITEFLAFYKEHYILQDFSVASLTDSREESKRESYAQLLKIVQESLAK
jgi:hypothetical protein